MKRRSHVVLDNLLNLGEIFDKMTRGVPVTLLTNAMNQVTPGVNWTGMNKKDLRSVYTGLQSWDNTKKFSTDQRRRFHEVLEQELTVYASKQAKRLSYLIHLNRQASFYK